MYPCRPLIPKLITLPGADEVLQSLGDLRAYLEVQFGQQAPGRVCGRSLVIGFGIRVGTNTNHHHMFGINTNKTKYK